MATKIPLREWNQWRSAIDAANSAKDKAALKEIQKQLIVKYGMDNDDVKSLIRYFAYTV